MVGFFSRITNYFHFGVGILELVLWRIPMFLEIKFKSSFGRRRTSFFFDLLERRIFRISRSKSRDSRALAGPACGISVFGLGVGT